MAIILHGLFGQSRFSRIHNILHPDPGRSDIIVSSSDHDISKTQNVEDQQR